MGPFIELVNYKYFSTAFSLTIKLRTKKASSPFRVVSLFNYKGTPWHASATLLGDTPARLVSQLLYSRRNERKCFRQGEAVGRTETELTVDTRPRFVRQLLRTLDFLRLYW